MLFGMDKVELKFTQVRLKEKGSLMTKLIFSGSFGRDFKAGNQQKNGSSWIERDYWETAPWCYVWDSRWFWEPWRQWCSLNEGYCEVKESSTNQCLLSRFKCGECWGYWGGSQGDVWTHLLLCWGEFFIASEYLASSNFFSLACQVHFHYVSGAEWRKRGGSGRPEASYCLAKHFHSGRSSWPWSGCHHQPITLWASVRSGNVIENHSCHHVLMRCFWGLLFLKLSPSLWILPK